MNPDISDTQEVPPAANAVSLFGQSGGMNDFPVLKAFQEYIDAEQAKARKRMFGLSIFFIVLLVVVVVTFTIVMTSVISRNQALSDRLLDIALREKNPAQPVVNVQQPVPTPFVQPVLQRTTESSELVRLQDALQRQKDELQREKEARQADLAKRDKEKIETLTAALAKAQQPVAPAPVVVTTSPTPVVPTAESAELIRLREELRREKEARKAEKDKQEKERQEAEKQAFLRRRYPDYYEKEDARKAAAAAEAARRATTPLPTPEPELTPATTAMPDSAELNRQREELRLEEEKLRREREEEAKRKAEQAKREEAKRKAEQAKREEEARRKAEQVRREEEAKRKAELAKREAEKKRAETEAAKRTAPPLPAPTLKPITYFDETKPSEDPELKELFKRPPAARATPQVAPNPAPQPAAKPAPNPPARPAATQKPVQKTTAQPTHKTETLAIGGAADGSSIPWLIEIPVQQHQ